MRNTSARSAAVLVVMLLSVALSAQRGGGGGRGGGAGSPDGPPTLLTEYDSNEYGVKFPAPPHMSMFTPEQPGKFRRFFTEGRIVYLVDLMGTSAAVTVRYLPSATEADLRALQSTLESNPPQAKLPGYRKISVGVIKIGVHGDKDAVEHVYNSKDKDVTTTTRQVVFVHKGKGFTFTCAAAEKDYAAADKRSFQPLFASIQFK